MATNVTKGMKEQGKAGSKPLYSLVDMGGGGELITLLKEAKKTKNYTKLDEKIRSEVGPFCNYGKGQDVLVSTLVDMRNNDRNSSGVITKPVAGGPSVGKNQQKVANSHTNFAMAEVGANANQNNGQAKMDTQAPKKRFTCWDINQRGTVGETIVHLCFLKASRIHNDLVKRLLYIYPNLVYDIYISEEYYGETILHMAVANENPAMVKFLLDNNADYNERATGNFFCPIDQRTSRTDTYEHEWVSVKKETNYEGVVYFGEYPLSFAACLGQEECVRLLVAKGANPNNQDSNGNTALHMLVIHDKKLKSSHQKDIHSNHRDMFDLILSLGGDLTIANRQGLTPLQLAAFMAKREMYLHILEKIQCINWIFGSVTCASYPLDQIDTINYSDGKINDKCVVNHIVYGDYPDHINMVDGVVVYLLEEKWKTFVRKRFRIQFGMFILYYICFLVAFLTRPGADTQPTITQIGSALNGTLQNITVTDSCYLMKVYSNVDIVRMVFECFVLIGAIIYLVLAGRQVHFQGREIFLGTLRTSPSKAIFLVSCCLIIFLVPGRVFCFSEYASAYEDVVAVFTILTTAPYFLFFFRGFKITGPFVVMIYKMIKGDLLRFLMIYVVFVIGFSQAMYIIFNGVSGSYFHTPIEAVMGMLIMSLGEFKDIYVGFDSTKHNIMGKILFLAYMCLVTLLLINMLIAMMAETYNTINNVITKEWVKQWANIVLVVEQSVPPAERKEQQKKYSQPVGKTEQRALVIRWHQTKEEKEKLREQSEKGRKKPPAFMVKRDQRLHKNNTDVTSSHVNI